jgi:hypothetical protein
MDILWRTATERTENHLQNGNANANGQIDQDSTTLLGFGRGDRSHSGNEIEATVNAKRCSWDSNRNAKPQARS